MPARKATTTGAVTAPDTVDENHPAIQAEIEALTARRDELRAKAGTSVDYQLALLRAEVQALQIALARAGVTGRTKHMSEGVREEIERVGYSTDPNNGQLLTREDLPK